MRVSGECARVSSSTCHSRPAWRKLEGIEKLLTEAEQVQAWQMDVVHQTYVRTADENYITARWFLARGACT
jgi:hypothetical protein